VKGPVIAAVLAVVVALVWAIVTMLRSGKIAHSAATRSQSRYGLRQFADQSLSLNSVGEILAFAREAAQVIFGSDQVVAFEKGADEGSWDASVPGERSLGEVPPALRGLFGWVRHNSAIAVASDLGESRFGAMRGPMRQVMESYGVDVLLPLVSQSDVLAVLGIKLGRRPTPADRELMRLFRLQATAACTNVRLHVEAAHVVSLAKEVDLAGAVKLALVPDEMEGSSGGLVWAGYYQAVSSAGSDFWGVYPLGNDRAVVIAGDAIGAGLAGALVSAVVKSCADAIFDSQPQSITPRALLGALNRALYRSRNSVHTSCFALLVDRGAGTVSWANAGHPFAYHVKPGGLGVLSGAGPLLGDEAKAVYREQQAPVSAGDSLVLFTNGLIQAHNASGKAYGERALQKVLKSANGAPAEIRDAILESIDQHRGEGGGQAASDDAALLVVGI
jgi:serine phosphatase RsbU (regulator of sigma subunit)